MEAGNKRGSTGSRVLKRTSSTPTTNKQFEIPETTGKAPEDLRTRLTSVSRPEYHDNLKPSLTAGLNAKIILTSCIITFGSSFLFGYNIGVLNQPVNLIKDFYNGTYTKRNGKIDKVSLTFLWAFTTAIFIPGGMTGAFLGGALADKLGRKNSILFSHVFTFTGSILASLCVMANMPELLMLGRFVLGVNSGIGNCIAPMYLSEIAPFNLRGAFGTGHQLAITIGICVSSIFGLKSIIGTPTLWPLLLLFEAIPALVSLIILPFLPESPRYLLLVKGDRDKAQQSLQFYRNTQNVLTDMEEMDTEQVDDKKKGEPFTLQRLFTTPSLRMPLFIACSLQIVQQFSGINAIFFYSNGIYKNAGMLDNEIPYAVIGTNAVNVAMTVISVPLMEIAGRRLLLLVPMCLMMVDLVMITIALNLKNEYHWMNYITVICCILYVICFAVGLGPIPMMIGAELFRQEPRPLAMATAGIFNWVFTFIIALGFESLALAVGDMTFLVFLVMMVFFTIFVYLKVPETKNKTFEEIAHQFAPGLELEVEEVINDSVFGSQDPMPTKVEDLHMKTIPGKHQVEPSQEVATSRATNGTAITTSTPGNVETPVSPPAAQLVAESTSPAVIGMATPPSTMTDAMTPETSPPNPVTAEVPYIDQSPGAVAPAVAPAGAPAVAPAVDSAVAPAVAPAVKNEG